ncbi:MAG: hypothetical protein C0410_09945 [Anaerolinea sp.]|nr:hypothetical protein [Anaerolinea sp.]
MEFKTALRIKNAIHQRWVHYLGSQRWKNLSHQVASLEVDESKQPIIFFNASTRLGGVSQNAAYSRLTSLGLRTQGIPVIHFVCHAGIQRCTLGSNRDNFDQAPPCAQCIKQSESLFSNERTWNFEFETDETLDFALETLSVAKCSEFTWHDLPLGFWALNSLRWVLRRYTLKEDWQTRAFMVSFIQSAWNVYQQFTRLVEESNPQAVVVFNGMFFPEAAVRQVCLERGIRVITHEVGIQPFSAFFTEGEATAYPMHIEDDFQLSAEMNARLDDYLSNRFKGNFSMAGIKFWPEMQQLDPELAGRIGRYKKIVPIFTNVIFDTSQVHANTLFNDMFQWLESIYQTLLDHPEVLFILRAHPDEGRKGKESRESVADWVKNRGLLLLPNVVFIDSNQFVSSYELIRRSHFVMNYNSTIGLEATLMGRPVLTAGKARYTQIPTTFFPTTTMDYMATLEKFLTAGDIEVPEEFLTNARRFLYAQLFLTSLPFGDYLKDDGVWKGYVTLRDFQLQSLLPENSETIHILADGILHGKEFLRAL